MIVLTNYYSVYDPVNFKIGLAPSKPNVTPYDPGYLAHVCIFSSLFVLSLGFFSYRCIYKPRMEKRNTLKIQEQEAKAPVVVSNTSV